MSRQTESDTNQNNHNSSKSHQNNIQQTPNTHFSSSNQIGSITNSQKNSNIGRPTQQYNHPQTLNNNNGIFATNVSIPDFSNPVSRQEKVATHPS